MPTSATLLLSILLCAATCQAQTGNWVGLCQAVLNHDCLKSYADHTASGRPLLDGIVTGGRLPATQPIPAWGLTVPVYAEAPARSGTYLRIIRLRMRGSEARYVCDYGRRVRGSFSLVQSGDTWQVDKAWVREKGLLLGLRGLRFCYENNK